MPKKQLTNEETITALYREHLRLVNPADPEISKDFEGDELRNFYKFCHTTFHNPFFGKIVNGFILEQCIKTAKDGMTEDHYKNGRLSIIGIKLLEEFFGKAAAEFDKLNQPEEPFDSGASFSQAKV